MTLLSTIALDSVNRLGPESNVDLAGPPTNDLPPGDRTQQPRTRGRDRARDRPRHDRRGARANDTVRPETARTLRPLCRPLALPLSRGAREGDAPACRVACLEPAIAREPEESRLGARDSEKGLTSRLSLFARTFGQGKVRTSGLPNEIRPCKETDDGEPKPGRRHPAIEASERNPLESQRCDRPRRCLSLPRSPAGGR